MEASRLPADATVAITNIGGVPVVGTTTLSANGSLSFSLKAGRYNLVAYVGGSRYTMTVTLASGGAYRAVLGGNGWQ